MTTARRFVCKSFLFKGLKTLWALNVLSSQTRVTLMKSSKQHLVYIKILLRSFKKFGRMKLLVIITRVTLIMSSKDFNNVTLLFDDHEFHAHKVILAVNIAAAFPIGEASPHSTGSSRGVTSLGSGHWRQVWSQNLWPYDFCHDICFEFFWPYNFRNDRPFE